MNFTVVDTSQISFLMTELNLDMSMIYMCNYNTWCQSLVFKYESQTELKCETVLHAQAVLIDNLLNESYQYLMTVRLQSDPIEIRFFQHGVVHL